MTCFSSIEITEFCGDCDKEDVYEHIFHFIDITLYPCFQDVVLTFEEENFNLVNAVSDPLIDIVEISMSEFYNQVVLSEEVEVVVEKETIDVTLIISETEFVSENDHKAFISKDEENMAKHGTDGGVFVKDVVADPLAYYILAKS